MASHTVVVAKHATLSGSTGDIVKLTSTWGRVQIVNRSGSDYLWVKVSQAPITDPVTPAGDDTLVVPPNGVLTVDTTNQQGVWVSVAGSSNPYSVQGVGE